MANETRACGMVVWGLLLAVGCSTQSAHPTPPQQARPSSGGEAGAPAPTAPAAEPAEPAVAPSGPAALTVEAAVHGEVKPARVQLIGSDGGEVAAGASGQPLAIQSGEYTLIVSIEDAAILADRPNLRVPLTVKPGDDLKQHVDFPWASVQLKVRVNGEPEGHATVRILRQGALVATVESGGAFVTLSPGRYQAEVITRDATIEVKQLLFPEGATQTVPVDVKM